MPQPSIAFDLADLGSGTAIGLVAGGGVTLAPERLDTLEYTDPFASVPVLGKRVDGSGTYVCGTWTSPEYRPGFAFDELVSSWNARTSPGTWVQSEARPRFDDGRWAKWYVLGRWAYDDSDFHRASVGAQDDADGSVAFDVLSLEQAADAYQLRLTICRRAELSPEEGPVSVSRYGAVASNRASRRESFPSATTMNGETVDLELPMLSQETHRGEYPELDNGGEAWCSPTSTAMVVRFWGGEHAPTEEETAWVAFADPEVDFTARHVYDYHYAGAGNWAFNAAYASERGLVADVSRLHDLREAEAFVRAGIPLIASVAWGPGELDGASIESTRGHLTAIGGFTGAGDVIAYDPAAPANSDVRRVYDRAQFEQAWIPASGGTVYVIRPPT